MNHMTTSSAILKTALMIRDLFFEQFVLYKMGTFSELDVFLMQSAYIGGIITS